MLEAFLSGEVLTVSTFKWKQICQEGIEVLLEALVFITEEMSLGQHSNVVLKIYVVALQ